MHNLCYLLTQKVQSVFNSGVIRTCIDQNWDLKGFKAVLLRILKLVSIEDTDSLITLFDKLIQSQNLQSQACIKAIAYYLKNTGKQVDEDDLRNPIQSYGTTFDFLRRDIEQFRAQKMKHDCFTVLHPWAYDLDTVDFKYVVNKDHVQTIISTLKSDDAKVFWLSFFKPQTACTADEFFNAIKEASEMNFVPEFFDANFTEYKKFINQTDYAISIAKHSGFIEDYIEDFVKIAKEKVGFSILTDQVRLK